jgi:branched-chain amino acid transport system permease protein
LETTNAMSLNFAYALQQVLNATQVAAFYGLLAVSYVLMHAITRRINFAFGALAIWASYSVVNVSMWLMLYTPGHVLLPLLAGAAVAIAHTVLTGLLIERSTVRPLVREPSLAMLAATLGLALAMEETMRLANDSREKWLIPLDGWDFRLGGPASFPIMVTGVQIAVVVIACSIGAGLMVFIARHPFGRTWRACAEDLKMAELTGVNVGQTVVITFALASACAAVAGVLMAVSYGVASFSGGFVIGLKTLFVAVAGGLNSVPGVFVGGILLGAFETAWSATFGPNMRDAAAFFVLTALMIARPQGLFGGSGRTEPV